MDTSDVSKPLYDTDFNIWLETTAAQLRSRNFDALDLENLIEEVESLARLDRRSLANFLRQICERLLRLNFWEAERDRHGRDWILEVLHNRHDIQLILEDSPSLRPYLDAAFPEQYGHGRKLFLILSGLQEGIVPATPCFTLEQALDSDWFSWQLDSSDNN